MFGSVHFGLFAYLGTFAHRLRSVPRKLNPGHPIIYETKTNRGCNASHKTEHGRLTRETYKWTRIFVAPSSLTPSSPTVYFWSFLPVSADAHLPIGLCVFQADYFDMSEENIPPQRGQKRPYDDSAHPSPSRKQPYVGALLLFETPAKSSRQRSADVLDAYRLLCRADDACLRRRQAAHPRGRPTRRGLISVTG